MWISQDDAYVWLVSFQGNGADGASLSQKKPDRFGLERVANAFRGRKAQADSGNQTERDHVAISSLASEPPRRDGKSRWLGNLILLELLETVQQGHEIHRGVHASSRDRVVVHLFDATATPDEAPALARQTFRIVQMYQRLPWIPRLLDVLQPVPEETKARWFFSMVLPQAPTLAVRQQDPTWTTPDRVRFAQRTIAALRQIHHPEDNALPPIRHLLMTPQTLHVNHDGEPVFAGFMLSSVAEEKTMVSALAVDPHDISETQEVQRSPGQGSDESVDIRALCTTLLPAFSTQDPMASQVADILQRACAASSPSRPGLEELANQLSTCLPDPQSKIPYDDLQREQGLPMPDYWDEETIVSFQQARYRIINRLGQGGIGQTFKVIQVDETCQETYGTYVAKVVQHDGEAVLRAYRLVRDCTAHPHLAVIHEIAPHWDAGGFAALLRWVDGIPLQDLIGSLSRHAQALRWPSLEILVARWLVQLCDALGELHRRGLVHGDVSPANIIITPQASAVLIDYDTICERDKPSRGGGTPLYASPQAKPGAPAHPSDDLFALATSFIHVLAGHEAFQSHSWSGEWSNAGTMGCDALHPFFQCATTAQRDGRPQDALAAKAMIVSLAPQASAGGAVARQATPPTLSANKVPWLGELLSAYPGSRHGNSETRGLDSDFAVATYVETSLDQALFDEIIAGSVHLVILFGNAGDGKTAFLQHLARRLGISNIRSQKREWSYRMADGRMLRVNLDGSAAWQGQSANQLLDDLFRPFHGADFPRDVVCVLAINSGKLLEWVETQGDTILTTRLRRVLMEERDDLEIPGLRLVDLNRRSLVGGIDKQQSVLTTFFLDALLNRFIAGANREDDPWRPCQTCLAQTRCTAWHSIQWLRHPQHGGTLRLQLAAALQACHQRGVIHITARELRGALSYIFFGVDECADLHEHPERHPVRFWERAFDTTASQRQGELLGELARFDPALEAHPFADRNILRQMGRKTREALHEGRRRAYFEPAFAGESWPIPLAGTRWFRRFRDVPLMDAGMRRQLLHDLCLGIAHLETLPPLALSPEQLERGVPLRLVPRTPTETVFWVIKPWERFALEAPLPRNAQGLEMLHTQLRLSYRYASGKEEVLLLGLELFEWLLALKDGVQLSSSDQDDLFANLKIFTQRLAGEEARACYAWHPDRVESIDRLVVHLENGRQKVVREPC